jgi:hypothetical protein
MSKPQGISDALSEWVDLDKEKIRGKLESSSSTVPMDRDALMARFVESPAFITAAWDELLRVMGVLKAPPAAVSEAQRIASNLAMSLNDRAFSQEEQIELTELIRQAGRAKSDDEQLELLKGAMGRGRLPPVMAEGLRPLIQGPPGAGGP